MKVQITSGGYGLTRPGSRAIKLVRCGEIVDVTESEANRLVSIGAGIIRAEKVSAPSVVAEPASLPDATVNKPKQKTSVKKPVIKAPNLNAEDPVL